VRDADGEPSQFTFQLESECRLRPAYMVMRGLITMRGKLVRLMDAVAADASDGPPSTETDATNKSKVNIIKYGAADGLYHVRLDGEGHTMGNLLQSMMYTRSMRFVEPAKRDITFVGYHKPHPLEDFVVLQLALSHSPSAEGAAAGLKRVRDYLVDSLAWAQDVVGALALAWYDAADVSSMALPDMDEFARTGDFGAGFAALEEIAGRRSRAVRPSSSSSSAPTKEDAAVAPTKTSTARAKKSSPKK
jgi:DNA-directed RNA polymerase subunit L